MSQELALKFTIEQINVVLNALGRMPYEEVYDLVESIQQQAGPQLQALRDAEDMELEGEAGDAAAESKD